MVTVSLLTLALLVGGCGRVTTVTRPSATSSSSPSPGTGVGASPDASAAEDASFTFDDVASYESGIEVEISGIVARAAPTGTSGAESTAGQIVVASVLIRNGTAAGLDATTALVTASYGAADTEAPLVSDPGGQLAGAFLGVVTPGGEVAADFGFAVPFSALNRVMITVDLGDGTHEPVSFTGTVERDG